jgi:hypothetical protein
MDKQIIHLDEQEAEVIKEKAIKETILFIQQCFERTVSQRSQSHFTKREIFELFKDAINFKKQD